MRICIMDMRVLMMLVLIAVVSNTVWASSTVPASDFPLTSQEQAARLWTLAGQEMVRKLYPSAYQRNYQRQWERASVSERQRLAERIGEEGSARYAAEHGSLQGTNQYTLDAALRLLESRIATDAALLKDVYRLLKSSTAIDKAKTVVTRILLAAVPERPMGILKLSPRGRRIADRAFLPKRPMGILKLSAKGIGRIADRAFLPITVGVESFQLIMASHEYGLGRISQREFYRRSAGPATTLGAAAIGWIIFRRVGAVMVGAAIGGIGGAGVVFAFDYYMQSRQDREFDAQQLRAVLDAQQLRVVNAAVDAFYGLEAHNEVVQH